MIWWAREWVGGETLLVGETRHVRGKTGDGPSLGRTRRSQPLGFTRGRLQLNCTTVVIGEEGGDGDGGSGGRRGGVSSDTG